MKRFLIFLFILFAFGFAGPSPAKAITDPTNTSNNRFGIHIVDTTDLKDAAALVNSSGGDWGYVTLVIQKGERDTGRWQRVFDEMRRLHLIPILRIATVPIGPIWEKPNVDEIDGWVSFLNSLNWVVRNRYVAIGNEPNQGKEWGGMANPEEYAHYFVNLAGKLKASSDDFFILSPGLDASAPQRPPVYMDEAVFLKRAIAAEPSMFDLIDGLNSHSYPNPAFSGSVRARGKGTVGTFEWELSYLKSLGIKKNLPVFITETGWINPNNAIEKLKSAYANVWNRREVVAVTPFILNYTEYPFSSFSWKTKNNGFLDIYSQMQAVPKTAGGPEQRQWGKILFVLSPPFAALNSPYYSLALVGNTGQSIWNSNNFALGTGAEDLKIESLVFPPLEPGQRGLVVFKGTPGFAGSEQRQLILLYKGIVISEAYEVSLRSIP